MKGQGQERNPPKVDHRTTRRLVPSGIDWIGDMPEGWKVERVKYHYDFTTGFTPPTSDEALYPDDGDVWVTIADLKEPVVVESQSHIDHEYAMTHINDQTKAGSLMYSFKLSVGTTAIAGADLFTNEAIASFQNTSEISIPFLKYSSSLIEYNAKKNIYNAALLNRQLIRDAPIVFPPLGEQEAIAAKLDDECGRIDSLTAKIEKEIAALEEYRKSLITKCVTKGLDSKAKLKPSGVDWIGDVPEGWKVERVKYSGSARNGLTYAPENVVEDGEGVFVLRSSNIQRGRLSMLDNVYVDMQVPAALRLKRGDIVLCSRNGSRDLIGKNVLIETDDVGTFGAFMMVFRANSIDVRFARWAFNSYMFDSYLGAFGTSTVNQLTNSVFSNMRWAIPSLAEQREIAAYLDKKCAAIDAVLAKRRKQLEGLAEYRKSVIYSYVTGKKEVAA